MAIVFGLYQLLIDACDCLGAKGPISKSLTVFA